MKRMLAVGRITAPDPHLMTYRRREVRLVADVGRRKPLLAVTTVAFDPAKHAEARRAEMAEARQRVFDSTATYDQENPQ